MRHKKFFSLALLLAVLLALTACNLPRPQPSAASPTPPLPLNTPSLAPTPTSAPPTEPPAFSRINLETLKNFTYRVDDFNTQVTLVDGAYSGSEFQSQLVEPVALGDLNGDGQEDAAVVLMIDPSGSGTFYYLVALLNERGSPVQAANTSIGDRQVIQDLQVAQGRVVLDYLTQGPGDGLCCPSQHRLRSYILENGALRLASEQVLESPAAQATPLPNTILIDQPSIADPLTSPQPVRGRVSQVPPGRTLAYYVTDMQANLLLEGEVPLQGEPGQPGSFAFEFSLGDVDPGLVQIELVDAAEGILHGRSTVWLVVP